ncbi:MAG: pilus assembly protein [Muribaculaceae bacterium]|nr:pilus assembly protein [Muribaculaceae bacterium]
MYKKTVKGYMTIEAAFIVPWVIFLIVFLIYVSFYFYDKCVLFQDAYTVCFRGSIQKEEGSAAAYVQNHLSEQFGRKYFGVGSVYGEVERSGKSLKVSGRCSIKIPFRVFKDGKGNGEWEIQTEAKAQIINPTKVIRRCRMAENLVQELTGDGS